MKYFLIFLFSITSFPSLAKIHFEPYVGYGFSIINKRAATKETVSNVKDSVNYVISGKKYHDLVGGIRLGYRSLGLALGVDASIGRWESFNSPEILVPFTAGLFASYNLPLLFRVYGVIIPNTPLTSINVNAKDNSQPALFCKDVTGGKLGLSYLSIPFLSINFEYQNLFVGGNSEVCNTWSHTGTVYINFMF